MKRFLKKRPALLALTFLLFLSLSGASTPASASVGVSVSFASFHGALAPYGSWVSVGRYGRCWRPARVAHGWLPYSNGRWLYTDYGWTWVSDDPWGDIACHYGTWTYDPGYGWVWVPGYVWGPAWVTWCFGNDFIGWAPLSPGFAFTTSGYFGRAFVDPASSYVFVPANRFVGVNASTARFSPTRNATFLRSGRTLTRFSTSRGVVRTLGPDPKRIESVTHRTIRPTSIAAAKLHPTRMDAGGRIRGSRVDVTARSSAPSGPAVSTRGHPSTMARSAKARVSPRKPISTTHRSLPKAQSSSARVQSHARPSGHPKTVETTHRNLAPRKEVTPQTHTTTLRRAPGPVPARTATHPVTPEHGARAVERAPAPVVTRERPVVHAAPQVQAHAAPRVESRPAQGPRVEARHVQPAPAPRASRKEDGR